MTRAELEHAIRAACDITHDTEVFVFGSQAVLGQFPDVPEGVRMSAEADISPKNRPEEIERLNAIGEDSPFHQLHGFYVHGLPIDEAAVLPKNWRARVVRVESPATRGNVGLCVEAHDSGGSISRRKSCAKRKPPRHVLYSRAADCHALWMAT